MRFKEVTNRGFGQGLRWLGLVLVLSLGLGQATAGVWTSHDGTVFTSFEEQVAYDEAHAAATMLHWLEYEEALGDRQAYGLFQFNPHAGHGATWRRENLEFTIVETFGGLNYTLGADGVVRLDPVYVRIRVVTVDIDHGVAMWREVTSIGLALLPVVGTAEAVVQLFTGMDSITGEVVDPWLAGLGVMASFIPGGRVVLKGGATAARAATAARNTPTPPGGRAPEIPSGQITESGLMRQAENYLGQGYREVSPGRYVSADGTRQFRYGAHETRNPRNHHAHFESLEGGRVTENAVVRIDPDP